MAFRALRSIIRPVSKAVLSTPPSSAKLHPIAGISASADLHQCRQFASSLGNLSFFQPAPTFDRLTDNRLPPRRPKLKSRKRKTPKPTGAAAWAKYIPMDNGNENQTVEEEKPKKKSAKRINEKKRLKLQRAFTLSEKKKRTALVSAAKRKKEIERVERKMAAVAREREWAQRLVELQQMEKEKKAANGLTTSA